MPSAMGQPRSATQVVPAQVQDVFHVNRCPQSKKKGKRANIFDWKPEPDHFKETHTKVEGMLHDLVRSHYVTYAIFWKEENHAAYYHSGFCDAINEKAMREQGLHPFTDLSKDFTFVENEGMVGRVMHSQKYEWIDNVQGLPATTFKRAQAASDSHIKTVMGVAVNGGVVELGSIVMVREDERIINDIKERFKLEFMASHYEVEAIMNKGT